MRRLPSWLICSVWLIVAAGCSAAAGSVGSSHPYPGTATLLGIARDCGGPHIPGHAIYCQPQPDVNVRVILRSGRYRGETAGTTTDRQGGFRLNLRPGHWAVVAALGADTKQEHVLLEAHKIRRIRFTYNTIK